MALDPVMELRDAIAAAFSENIRKDAFIQDFLEKAKQKSGDLTLEDVQKFSERLGEATSKALLDTVGTDVLTDEQLKREVTSRLVRPMLEQNFDNIQAEANRVQKIIDESAGIGLNGVSAEFPEDRAVGLVDKVNESESVEAAQSYFGEPVVNFHMHGYDSWVETNAKFRADAGMTSRIIRRGHFGMCPWCASLTGTFEYYGDNMPNDIFRRHKNCKCVVLFTSERGKFRDVHSKVEYSAIRDARVARLQQLELERRKKEGARKVMRDRVNNGEYNLTLLKQKYAKHVDGTPQYKNTAKERGIEPSRLTVSYEEAQRLINLYSGTGEPKISNGGKTMDIEFVRLNKTVGQYKKDGKWVDTKCLAIYHSKKGTHIVPVPPGKEM